MSCEFVNIKFISKILDQIYVLFEAKNQANVWQYSSKSWKVNTVEGFFLTLWENEVKTVCLTQKWATFSYS